MNLFYKILFSSIPFFYRVLAYSFSIENAFSNGLNDVNEKKLQLEAMQEAFARGEDVNIHDMMIASEKSMLSMQMAMQIRNKMISAYTDLKNMNM